MISYKEYIKKVPIETKEYIDRILGYIYVIEKGLLNYLDDYRITPSDFKEEEYFAMASYFAVRDFNKFNSQLTKQYQRYLNITESKKEIAAKCSEETKSELFKKYYKSFDYDEEDIHTLTIEQLFANAIYYDRYALSQFFHNFSRDNLFNSIKIEATNIKKEELDKVIKELEQTGISINIINFILYAASIKKGIKKAYKNYTSTKIELTEEDYIPLSILFGIYPNSSDKSSRIEECNTIKIYLSQKGISPESIFKSTTNTSSIETTIPQNVYLIRTYYLPLIEQAIKKYNKKDISISEFLSIAFDSKINNSRLIEKLSEALNVEPSIFLEIENNIEQEKEKIKKETEDKQFKDFFINFDSKVKEYMILTFKIYTYLLKEINTSKTYNDNLLHNEDDLDTLALFIASYKFNGNVSSFYLEHGITLEKIEQLLRIKLDFNQIEKIEYDITSSINRFKRFTNKGVNENKRTITLENIINNLCNKEFNKTTIMEDIFAYYVREETLDNNFYNQMNSYFNTQEKERKKLLRETTYKDLDPNIIYLLDRTINIYEILLRDRKDKFNKEELKIISFLIAILTSSNKTLIGYIESKGITLDKISKRYDINLNSSVFNKSKNELEHSNISLLLSDLAPFIFTIDNKSIKEETILINLFNKDLTSVVDISSLFLDLKIDYDTFINFDEEYINFQKEEQIKEQNREIDSSIRKYESSKLIYQMLRYHERIKKLSIPELTDSDLIELSFTLAIITGDYNLKEFYVSNGITLETIIKKYNLPKDISKKITEEEIDYHLFKDLIEPFYLKDIDYSGSTSKLISKLLGKEISSKSKILEDLLGDRYDKFEIEITTGKPYEDTLSIKEHTKLLESEEIPSLDVTDTGALVAYGGNLRHHTSYLEKAIYETATNLSNDPLSMIVSIINSAKPQEKKVTRGFIFKREEVEIVPGTPLDKDKIFELQRRINEAIEELSKGIITYDELVKYVRAFISKQEEYLSELDSKKKEYEEYLKEHPELDEFEKYKASLIIHNLEAKRNTFITSIVLWKQEELKYLQVSSNHLTNVSNLFMIRDSILPLISSESLISESIKTESDALKLQSSVIGILDGLISKNQEEARKNVEALRGLNIPANLIEGLSTSIDNQLRLELPETSTSKVLKLEDNQ